MFDLIERAYISTVSRTIAHMSKSIVTMTTREAMRFATLGVGFEKCVVIPSGVDSELFRPANVSIGRKRVVWTGRFVPEKNLSCLLRAVALLKNKVPDLELVLAGEGPECAKLMSLSRSLHVNERVIFPGLLSRRQIVNLLRDATIYALPSTAEALPIAVLEAMSSGVPLIVSKRLGLEEVVDDAALMADPRNPKEWALLIEMLLMDEELRRKLAIRSRQLVETRYDWAIVSNRLERLFTSSVEGAFAGAS